MTCVDAIVREGKLMIVAADNLLEQPHDDTGVPVQQKHGSITHKRRAILGNRVATANGLVLETIAPPYEGALEFHFVQSLAVLVVARACHISHEQLAGSA